MKTLVILLSLVTVVVIVAAVVAYLGRADDGGDAAYREALEQTQNHALASADPAEIPGLAAFKAFFASVTEESAREQGPQVYAPEAWFFDTLKEIRGGETIAAYLADTAARAERFEVEFDSVAVASPNVYVRWTMTYLPKGWEPDRVLISHGMSQLRFDSEGRVVLHRDFWDAASGFYEHIPGLGHVMRIIRRRAI